MSSRSQRRQHAAESSEGAPVISIESRKNGLLDQYGCGPVQFAGSDNALYERHLLFDNAAPLASADARTRFEAFARSVRDVLSQRWALTEETYRQINPKRVYYLSMEYLLGRSLANNVTNLLLDDIRRDVIKRKNIDWLDLLEQEPDAGLGNGGLGRLAACFLDSMATLQLPAMGYGLRYEYGIFRQSLENGWQREEPDNWLRTPDPWELMRLHESVEVSLNCSFELDGESLRAVPGEPSTLTAIPFDRPVVGYGGKNINTLRLWAAATPAFFDFQEFSSGDFVAALAHRLSAETITRVLYPDDSTGVGKALRFVQEYFLIAASLADLVRRFRRANEDWAALPEKVAVQLNDTHPALAIPELLRILLDDAHLDWNDACKLTQDTLAYTNHTLLPEALEQWPVAWFEIMLPRHLALIYEMNQQLLDCAELRFPGDMARRSSISLIGEQSPRVVRMANLAIVGSHSTNGVAALHSELLRKNTVRDLADLFPERFNNKTNGVTPRRWLLLANPSLANLLTAAIGDNWIADLSSLQNLASFCDNGAFQAAFLQTKREAKCRFSDWLMSQSGEWIDPETIFDTHIKRIHEYKRQLMNVLRIVVAYNRIRTNPHIVIPPRTFLFAGKAAPAYNLAKLIIKLISSVAATIGRDPEMPGRLKVVFIPDYSVSIAERLIPATDISNQISTAGYEASGTSNMKFMMNGALTVGTRDGATIEMATEAGEDNLFLFGLNAEQVASNRSWYSPYWHYENEPETRAALDLIFSNYFNPSEPGIFEPLRQILLDNGDYYMHLADLKPYIDAQGLAGDLYSKPKQWARKAILNIAASGSFSSDRTIDEYANEIWNVVPCPVE